MRDLQTLVDGADEAALLLAVDGLCAARDWDELADLARRCRDALELGRQLWAIAMHIDYRLALEGPPAHAAAVLRPGAGRFALGPLTEVAASTHDWDSLAPHIEDPASTGAVAQERVLRGEDLRGRAPLGELPLILGGFEPAYPLPRYRDRSAAFGEPGAATRSLPPARATPPGAALPADPATDALEAVVETWTATSAGQVRAVAADSGAAGAVGLLAAEAALQPITAAEGLALLQWAGASGGAYGRRRGGGAGRFAAWWAAAALAGVEWPDDLAEMEAFGEELGAAIGELSWFRWRAEGAATAGWQLHLAVADPVDGLAWAVAATDRRDDDALPGPRT
ncbi:hypothetical protein BH23ACT8_BH23ACT8_00280 [soil metagenome]